MDGQAGAHPVLFVDTRQKSGKHDAKHEQMAQAYELRRTKLYVGDYMLPGGLRAVDTKASIGELAANLRQQHARFRDECDRAREAGIELWVLTENTAGIRTLEDLGRWSEPAYELKKRGGAAALSGAVLAKTCKTMHERHGVRFAFCAPDEAGDAVLWILEDERNGQWPICTRK